MKQFLSVTKYTVIEVYRSRIMMSLFFLSLVVLTLSYVASEFGYGAPGKVALDVGIGLMSLSNVVIAILLGATLIGKEIEQKTLYMVLSKPVSRDAFLLGKIFGLSTVLLINTILLGALSCFIYKFFEGELSSLMIWVLIFSFLEAFLVLFFSVLFSLVTNTTLAVIYTLVVYVVGHALNETLKMFMVKSSAFLSFVLETAYFIIPNFYRLNLKDHLIYEQTISASYYGPTLLYVSLYLLAIMGCVIVIFRHKNLD